MTEDEYRVKLALQFQRDDANGHGWPTKAENPGWIDDIVVGKVISR